MAQGIIVPVAKSLYLCDGHLGMANQKTDLMGIFNSIRLPSYPHLYKNLVVYSRLGEGLGQVPFYVEVRDAGTDQLVHVTNTYQLTFPNRDVTVEMVLTMDLRFPQSGVYLVELYCDAQWVADTRLLVH